MGKSTSIIALPYPVINQAWSFSIIEEYKWSDSVSIRPPYRLQLGVLPLELNKALGRVGPP